MTSHVLENMGEAISNNYSAYHQAVDIVGAGNTVDDVVAISDGVVEMVVKDVKYTNHNTEGTDTYGNFVKLRHENGKKSLYAHLKYGSVSVNNGQAVSKGEKIGTMGQTGNAYGTHLHFEVRGSNETRENPNDYLSGSKTLDVVDEEVKAEVKEEDTEAVEENVVEKETTEEDNTVDDSNEIIEETTDTINEEITYDNKKEVTTSETINKLTDSSIVRTSSASKHKTVTLENKDYHGGSIVDGLKTIGFDSSYDNRCIIALKNGIEDYRGTYDQNVYLLKLLKQGKLKA